MKHVTFRRFLIMGLLLVLIVGFTSCTQNTGKGNTDMPTERPVKQPANNEKTDLLGANNKYKDVAIYDKFGA